MSGSEGLRVIMAAALMLVLLLLLFELILQFIRQNGGHLLFIDDNKLMLTFLGSKLYINCHISGTKPCLPLC